MFWSWKKTHQDHSGAAKYTYRDNRALLTFQQFASPFFGPIVKNLAPIGNINPIEGPQIYAVPATLTSGYGGLATGQMILQSLQDQNFAGSGGL